MTKVKLPKKVVAYKYTYLKTVGSSVCKIIIKMPLFLCYCIKIYTDTIFIVFIGYKSYFNRINVFDERAF